MVQGRNARFSMKRNSGRLKSQFPNFSFNVALSEPHAEDNWTGYTGFIHQVLYEEYLIKHGCTGGCGILSVRTANDE